MCDSPHDRKPLPVQVHCVANVLLLDVFLEIEPEVDERNVLGILKVLWWLEDVISIGGSDVLRVPGSGRWMSQGTRNRSCESVASVNSAWWRDSCRCPETIPEEPESNVFPAAFGKRQEPSAKKVTFSLLCCSLLSDRVGHSPPESPAQDPRARSPRRPQR